MDWPQQTADQGLDNLTTRLVTVVITEMTACLSRWRTYAASKDVEIYELKRERDTSRAESELQKQITTNQAAHIRSLEFEMMRMRSIAEPMSPTAFDEVLQTADTPGSVVERQSSAVGEAFDGDPQEGLSQGLEQGLGPLLALAGIAVDDTAMNHSTGKDLVQGRRETPTKRKGEEVSGASKRCRST